MKKIFAILILIIANTSFGSNHSYNKLRFMDYNELRQIKNGAINASRKFQYPRQEEKTLKPLREAMTMLLSRPNDDNVVSTLITDIESELETLGAYEKTIQTIVDESLSKINDKNLGSEFRTTSALCIKNLLLEIKPKILKNTNLAKIVCKLADQKIKVPEEIQESSMFKSLYLEKSPSSIAQKIMIWYAEQKKVKITTQSNGCPFSKRAI